MSQSLPWNRRWRVGLAATLGGLLLAGCGGGGASSGTAAMNVGVTVSGLHGSGLVLQDNGSDNLAIGTNGPFSFAQAMVAGSAYSVSVKTQPLNPAQTCSVAAGSGVVGSSAPNVGVNCVDDPLAVSVLVGGLTGSGLVLQDNGGDDLMVATNGSVSFATRLSPGAAYGVTVKTQPTNPAQLCTVSGSGSGIIGNSAPGVALNCVDAVQTSAVAVAVGGLVGTGLVLQDNGGDDLAVAADGSATFATRLAAGSAYAVSVKAQPSNPAQTCVVAGGSGVVGSAGATVTATVTCTTNPVDTRPLQVSLSPLPNAAMGVIAPYVLTEAQGIALTSVSWTFDGQPGPGSSSLGVALHVWNTPGTHTVVATANASNGRSASATMTVFAVSQPLAAGQFHACALTAGRAAKCWGDGNSGEIGNNTTTGATTPVDVSGLSGLLGLAAGDGHSCALKADGTVACWGDNTEGQLGNASTFHGSVNPLQKPVDGLGGVVALATGRYHTCALEADGSVACFGQNSENELGTGSSASASAAAVKVAGLSNAVAITAGNGYFSCALKADATVACWGDNSSGQLGNNNAAVAQTGTPQTVQTEQGTPLANVLVVRAGENHACAIVADGQNSVYCWGNNGYSQVSGVAGNHYGAVKVAGPSNVLMLSLTAFSSCALDTSFALRCWGSNGFGESTGAGGGGNVANATALTGLQGGQAPDYAGGGNEYLCALKSDGSAACVGRGGNGQLGNGMATDAGLVQGVAAPAGTFWHWQGP